MQLTEDDVPRDVHKHHREKTRADGLEPCEGEKGMLGFVFVKEERGRVGVGNIEGVEVERAAVVGSRQEREDEHGWRLGR
jgi:hypothetical protein